MKESGQAIIEVLVALALAVMVISSVSVAILSALKGAQDNRNKTNASQLAQQGMEEMRVMQLLRADNWQSIAANAASARYCLNNNCPYGLDNVVGSSCTPQVTDQSGRNCTAINNMYLRTVSIANSSANSCGTNATKIDVTVLWSDSKCTLSTPTSNPYCNSVTSSSCFSNTRQIQTP